MSLLTDGVADSLDFVCPRCAGETSQRFYGPCGLCVSALRATIGLDQRGAPTAAEYTPKMNVTPNFVATKD